MFGQGEMGEQASKGAPNTTQLYELLEVSKDATTEQIRKAFRKKALKEHPDKGGDPDKFKRISEACQILTNPQKRQLYNEYGEEGVKNGGPPNQGGLNNLFNMFNKKSTGPNKVRPKLIQVEVTLEQIFIGGLKKIQIERIRLCGECQGKGGNTSNGIKCDQCAGNGSGMLAQGEFRCEKCNGTGTIMSQQDRCKSCEGKKVHQNKATIEIGIQPGVPQFHDYVLTGQSDQYPGALAGDIYARIKILPHQIFTRKGADLFITKEITLRQALTGVTFTLKHLDGKQHIIATAPGEILHHKAIKIVKRLGMPFYKDSISHGNLIVQFNVKFPNDEDFIQSSREQICNLLKQLKINEENSLDSVDDSNFINFEQYSEEKLNKSPYGPKGEKEKEQNEEGAQGTQISCNQQ